MNILNFRDDLTLRTAKLALGRARRRRQCFQARRSKKKRVSNDTNMLVKSVRESTKFTVRCLQEIEGVKPKPIDRLVKF